MPARAMSTRLCSTGVFLVFAAVALLTRPASVAAQAESGPFVLRRGVVVSSDRSTLYLMQPGGGIAALNTTSGQATWVASEATQPLQVAGDLLVAIKDRPGATGKNAAVDVLLLNASDGRKRRSVTARLPEGVWSSVDDGPGRSLRMAATVNRGGVTFAWASDEFPMSGMEPRPPAGVTRRSGAFRIDVGSGRMQAMAGAAATEAAARIDVPISDETRLPQVPGTQYLSADGRHVLASELVGDESVWEKYLWTIYSLEGTRIGEVRSAFPQASWFVSGTLLVFEEPASVRRVDERLSLQPMRLRAVDLTRGSELWAVPLRDTRFYGPFPEAGPVPAGLEPEEQSGLEGEEEREREEREREQEEEREREAEVASGIAPAEALDLEGEVGLAAFGGAWQATGPAPKRGGASENAQPGNEVGGAVHALAAHPTDANILYVGTTNGGIWKTTNAAAARPIWAQVTDPQRSLSIGALDFDPADTTSRTLVAGIGRFSSFARRGGPRTGLLRTTDAGATWTPLPGGILPGKNISGVAVSGTRIAVAVNAADVAGLAQLGIFRSTNSGATFVQISSGNGATTGLPAGITHDLVRDPLDANRLFTGVVSADSAGGRNGLYRSINGGANWTKVSTAIVDATIISGSTDNIELAVGRSNNVYAAITRAGRLAGLFRSGDGGTTWAALDVPNVHPGAQGGVHLSIVADPGNATLVYVGGDRANLNEFGARNFSGRLFRCNAAVALGTQCVHLTHSRTSPPAGGGTLSNSSPHADSREMVFDAAGNIIQGDDGGVYRRTLPRTNQGDWFSISNNMQVFEMHSIAFDANANIVIGGAQDNGTGREAVPNGVAWENTAGGDGGDVAVDSISTPGLSSRYGSSQNLGGFRRQVFNANNVLQSSVAPALTLVGGGVAPVFSFITPLRINNVNGRRLIIGAANGVYESLDQGATIRQLTPLIPVNSNGGHPLGYGATGNAEILYVGSADRIFVRTAAAPAPLVQSASYPGTGSGRPVLDVALDPTTPTLAFVVDGAQVYLTRNAGASWTNITGNLPTLNPGTIRSVTYIENATGDGVAVGTNSGVFAAPGSAGFSTWSALGTGLPNAQAFDLDYVRADDLLVVGTLGRGSFSLPQPSFQDAAPPPPPPPPAALVSASFDAGVESFGFADDSFGTSQPNFASGTFVNPGGFSGGGLQISVGGIDDTTVVGMSGAWGTLFNVATQQRLTLSFDFNMTLTSEYEADEFSETLVQFDLMAATVQARITGDGNGGAAQTTGPISRQIDLGCVPPGFHALLLGLRNNKKTLTNESTTLLLDNIVVRSAGACP